MPTGRLKTGRLDLGAGFYVEYLRSLRFSAGLDKEADLDYDVTIELDDVDGRLVCGSMLVRQLPDGAPVTSAGLARLPVVGLFRAAAQTDEVGAMPRIYRAGRLVKIESLPTSQQTALAYRVGL